MNPESAAADQMLRMELMVTESAVKLAAKGAVNLAALLVAVLRNEKQIAGKTDIEKIIQSGTPTSFPLAAGKMQEFIKTAKEHGVMCAFVRDPKNPDTVDVIVREEDAKLVNMVREKVGATAEVSEKNAETGPSESALPTSGSGTQHGPASTMTQMMQGTPTQAAPRTSTAVTIDHAQMERMLSSLTGIRSAMEQGANPEECRAVLRAVQDELARALGMPERSGDKTADRQAAPRREGRQSVKEKIAGIRARAAHEPQHLKQPGKHIAKPKLPKTPDR